MLTAKGRLRKVVSAAPRACKKATTPTLERPSWQSNKLDCELQLDDDDGPVGLEDLDARSLSSLPEHDICRLLCEYAYCLHGRSKCLGSFAVAMGQEQVLDTLTRL